jgi:hypothetical protein
MTHAGHRAYKKVDQKNRPCDLLNVGVEELFNKKFMESVSNS